MDANPVLPAAPPVLPSPPPAPSPVNRRRWWVHLLLITGYIVVVGLLAHQRYGKPMQAPALTHTVKGLLSVCASNLFIFAVVVGLAVFASRASREDLLLRWRRGFWPVPLGIGYSIALRFALFVILATAGAVLVQSRAMTPESFEQFSQAHRPNLEVMVDAEALRGNPVYFWLVLTLVSFVVAGLREELWRAAFLAGLRSLWPRHFGSRAGGIAAVGIAAVVFGCAHLVMGPVAVLLTGLLGFGLGLIMVFHRSIWPAVIAHGMFDATTLALVPWLTEKLRFLPQAIGS